MPCHTSTHLAYGKCDKSTHLTSSKAHQILPQYLSTSLSSVVKISTPMKWWKPIINPSNTLHALSFLDEYFDFVCFFAFGHSSCNRYSVQCFVVTGCGQWCSVPLGIRAALRFRGSHQCTRRYHTGTIHPCSQSSPPIIPPLLATHGTSSLYAANTTRNNIQRQNARHKARQRESRLIMYIIYINGRTITTEKYAQHLVQKLCDSLWNRLKDILVHNIFCG